MGTAGRARQLRGRKHLHETGEEICTALAVSGDGRKGTQNQSMRQTAYAALQPTQYLPIPLDELREVLQTVDEKAHTAKD